MDTNSRTTDSQTYTLRQLFGGNITIVIPDMQRDYCWGNDGPSGKAGTFVAAILDLFAAGRPSSLGLLYGYENPTERGHIHIIDGQQRITTLYLLIGMLYRRTPRDDLRKMLISDYELLDDREPRLLYEERNEAMYFMSELVTHFFLNRDGRLSQLEKSSWYCSTYSTDSTVQSFIGAIRKIDEAIEDVCHTEGWDFDNIADFVTDKLKFFYHDPGGRRAAEELYVTINTTGEPLTLPQRLKARISGDTVSVGMWEDMDRWAWANRRIKDPAQPETSDRLLENLFHIWEKYAGREIHDISAELPDIYRFFQSYRVLCDCVPAAIEMKAETPADMFVVLPSVTYINKWTLKSADREIINDFTGLLMNVTRYQRVSPSGADAISGCRMVDKMASSDILSLRNLPEHPAPKILNEEEITKLRLIASIRGERRKLTDQIRKGESHPLLNGKLQKVISWCYDKSSRRTDTDRLSQYIDMIYEIWGTEIDRRADLDTLRRALLTLRHNGYPMQKRGDTALSLCWHDYEWQRLMVLSPGVVRQIIDRVKESRQPPAEALKKMAGRFNDKTYPYNFLVKSAEKMSKCLHRSLLRYGKPFIGYYMADPTTGKPVTHWIIDGHEMKTDTDRWSVMRPYGTRCLYTDHRWMNISMDIHYLPDNGKGYRIEVFSRDETSSKEPCDLRTILIRTGRRFSFDKKSRKFYTLLEDSKAAVELMQAIMSDTRNQIADKSATIKKLQA